MSLPSWKYDEDNRSVLPSQIESVRWTISEKGKPQKIIDKLSTQIEDNKETEAVGSEEVISVCVYLI